MGKISLLFCFCVLLVFGFANGTHNETVGFYELKNENITMKLTNWGASLVSFIIPDKSGKPVDIVLGYDTIEQYKTDDTYFGSIVGRVANRIKGARFKLNGQEYKLVANEGKNMLHGGPKGFSDVVWKVSKYINKPDNAHIVFTYHSPDGDQGFPGELVAKVSYKLLPGNQLSVIMKGIALNKPTPVSLAQHTYWNLGGHNSGDILTARMQIFGQFYTPVDNELIPTGQTLYARGTAYDFTEPERKSIGLRLSYLPNGYDINYILDGAETIKLRPVVVVQEDKTGLAMELSSNAPGMQVYSGNKIKDVKGKGGAVYKAHAGLCLETQWYPDYVNHPKFPQSIAQPGKKYKHEMLYTFSHNTMK